MNGFSVDIPQQGIRFACMLAFGAADWLLYRIFAAGHRRGKRLRGMLLDTGFWLITLTAFILLILGPCGGELRLYHLCGVGCGFASAAWMGGLRKEKT